MQDPLCNIINFEILSNDSISGIQDNPICRDPRPYDSYSNCSSRKIWVYFYLLTVIEECKPLDGGPIIVDLKNDRTYQDITGYPCERNQDFALANAIDSIPFIVIRKDNRTNLPQYLMEQKYKWTYKKNNTAVSVDSLFDLYFKKLNSHEIDKLIETKYNPLNGTRFELILRPNSPDNHFSFFDTVTYFRPFNN